LKELDVADDYPGFVVDEVLGRELAATIAGGTPLAVLAQATFHYADIHTHTDGGAGLDDLDAALAAGLQTRLPGWEWRTTESPFDVE
jgi:phosphatidylglycerophosphatase A